MAIRMAYIAGIKSQAINCALFTKGVTPMKTLKESIIKVTSLKCIGNGLKKLMGKDFCVSVIECSGNPDIHGKIFMTNGELREFLSQYINPASPYLNFSKLKDCGRDETFSNIKLTESIMSYKP
jgi:hypothetical protein